jgi:hypothetical protein
MTYEIITNLHMHHQLTRHDDVMLSNKKATTT